MRELPEYLKDFLKFKGIDSLTEPQEQSLPYIIDRGNTPNIVVASPTGSGKTLIGEMGILEAALIQKKKAAYLVPLKSLAKEKYDDLLEYKSKYGLKVTLRTGGYDSDESDISEYDLVVSTYEKWDSITRRGPKWMEQIGAVVVDEAHMITDQKRGPALECMLTRMRIKYPLVRLILLSAVMPNIGDFAAWLGAKTILSDWRAVPLKRGAFISSGQTINHNCGTNSPRLMPGCQSRGCSAQIEGKIRFVDGSERAISIPKVSSAIPSLCIDILQEGGQALVFAKSRAETIRLAKEIGASISMSYLSSKQKNDLAVLVRSKMKSLNANDFDTVTLLNTIENGAAYHNAGMETQLRRIVEEGFRDMQIKVIVATPTLAQGVNLPARRVIIQSIQRWTRDAKEEIPRWEAENQMGRAGRRAYDKYGEAVILDEEVGKSITKDGEENPLIVYLRKPIENIESKLFTRTNILSHLLAEITFTRGGIDRKYVDDFFSSAFGTKSGQINGTVSAKVIEESLAFLSEFLLVEKKDNVYLPTDLGVKLSQKYVNPTNMQNILSALSEAERKVKSWESLESVGWLHLACTAVEFSNMRPVYSHVYPFSSETLLLTEDALFYEGAMEYGNVLSDFIEELSRNEFPSKYRISYADLLQATENANWILSTIYDLAVLRKCSSQIQRSIEETLLRVKSGVKTELLNLVKLKGIGRVWARQLFRGGIRTREEFLASKNWKKDSQILGGRANVKKILEENGIDVSDFERTVEIQSISNQSSLM